MTAFRSDFLRIFQERGFLYQATDLEALDAAFAKGPVTSYWGMDATADSLHVGSLVGIMANRWLQKTGHKPILLIGGGTTKIGDPSGRDESRQLISNETIAANAAGIRRSLAPFIDLDATQMVDNAEWLDQLQYIPFLREVGRHFSINRMLSMDSVKLRLDREQPLSFLEFNYMILQAYDFVELYKRYGVNLQIGGSDQWGNIVSGTDLGRRLAEAELYGLTWPLLATASGAKMGKSAQGAIWLNADRLGPYDYWQYWRNTEDADVERFLKLFTELPLDEIARLAKLQGAEINEAKKVLATEATALAHGRDAALEAAETARRTFEEGAATGEALPSTTKARSDLQAGISVVDLLAELGLAASKGEARRLIKGGGVRLNDVQVSDENAKLTESALDGDGVAKLSAGKKRHALVKAS
jgi:tyrosyl-tRNA synthetase